MDEEQKTQIDNEEGSSDLEKAQKQAEDNLAGWQRAKADFVNYKREEAGHLEEVARYATENFMREMISVLDSFDLGLSALEKQGPVEKGIYMIKAQFEDVLRRNGLEKMEVLPGMPFDPASEEAIGETESSFPAGVIADVIESGYQLNGRVLRPARVRLSKSKSDTTET